MVESEVRPRPQSVCVWVCVVCVCVCVACVCVCTPSHVDTLLLCVPIAVGVAQKETQRLSGGGESVEVGETSSLARRHLLWWWGGPAAADPATSDGPRPVPKAHSETGKALRHATFKAKLCKFNLRSAGFFFFLISLSFGKRW